ncbi:neutral zinc metallopeptidase [Enemella sp. A6]|uniref:neutral zinc metallopeptidase n=1 Tax=Enemella sp. A6 TaxID=3440152 RepID=UPI003EBBEA7B
MTHPYGVPAQQPPRPPAPRPARWPLAVIAAVVVLALVIGAVLMIGRSGGADTAEPVSTPEPTEASPASQAPPPPEPTAEATTTEPSPTPSEPTETKPSAPEGTDGKPETGYSGNGMTDTRLYNVMWANGSQACSPTKLPEPPLPDEQLAGHLQDVMDCITEVHKPALAEQGITITSPKVVAYADTQSTPCGTISNQNPAFYCSGDQTLYVRYDSDENPNGYARSNMGYWILATHEFGHHLQAVTGIFDEYSQALSGANAEEKDALSRRLEAQATCFSGVFLGATRVSLKYDDNVNATRNFYRFNGGRGYASGENMVAWFERGYDVEWNAFARCNTWSAPDDQVS